MTERCLPALCCLLATALAGCGAGTPAATGGAAPAAVTGIRYLSAAGSDVDDFASATAPRDFVFPADHLAHPAFRSEWWYFTGNLFDAAGRHFGFELTLFRIALAPAPPARESAFATSQIWLGNLAVTDTARRRFAASERLSRGAAGLAGAALRPDGGVLIRLEDWSIEIVNETARLTAGSDDFGIDLELEGLDRFVPQGDRGLDAKGPEPGNASYYFSAPRLAASGTVTAADGPVAVTGSAWMDREWSTSALSPDIEGWDWFALQLDDGRDLMFYRLRSEGGGTSPFSGGSISRAAGAVTTLNADQVTLAVTREWTSPTTGIRYPVGWRLTIPDADLELGIRPRIDAQELDLTVRYWEGAVSVSGRDGSGPVTGVGYLELAGY